MAGEVITPGHCKNFGSNSEGWGAGRVLHIAGLNREAASSKVGSLDQDGTSRDGNLSGRANRACGQMGHGVEAMWVTNTRLLAQGARRPGKEKAGGTGGGVKAQV